MLTAADVHVAARLAELGGEPDETVRLAIALRRPRGAQRVGLRRPGAGAAASWRWSTRRCPGRTAGAWLAAVLASPLVGEGKPLRWEYGLLYLDRYRRQEEQVRRDLLARDAQPPPVGRRRRAGRRTGAAVPRRRTPSSSGSPREVAATEWTTVLGGGPGTGKTTTVARMLALLLDQPAPPLRVAMAAPTGKAAARLQAAVQAEARTFAARGPARPADADRVHPAPAAGLGARRRHPVPAQPGQPAAVRRGGRRRDVDGVADHDGPAAGGRPARTPG